MMTEKNTTIEQELSKQTSVFEELVKNLEKINTTLLDLNSEIKAIKEQVTRRDRRK